MTRKNVGRLTLLLTMSFVLTACGDWLGRSESLPLPGARVSVLSLERALKPDPSVADMKVRIPKAWRNEAWPLAGGSASHAMYHLAASPVLKLTWRQDIGEGNTDERLILSQPVSSGGRVFTMDAVSQVSAYDLASGKRLWSHNLTPDFEDEGGLGGGLATDGERVYASTAYGDVFALEAKTGKRIWQRNIGPPIRGAPTLSGGRLFVISHNNKLHALSAKDGAPLWQHAGLPENAGLVGGASAAVAGGIVVAPYSSGELYAFRVENGRVVWNDQLVRRGGLNSLAALAAIRAQPVIDQGRVFAVSHSGRIASFDLRSGRRYWDREIAGVETPWLAGDFLYMVTPSAELLCLSRATGRVRWLIQLDRFRNPEDLEGPIIWNGPILLADKLVVMADTGAALSISPFDGKILSRSEIPSGAAVAPIVVDGTMLVLTQGGELLAYR